MLLGPGRSVAPGAATSGPSAAAFNPRVTDQVVQTGLVTPWDIAFTPDGRMLVTERRGTVEVFAPGAAGAAELATFSVDNVRELGEAGLMGIAVDSAFAANGLVYVCATRTDPPSGTPVNQVVRYRLAGTSWTFDGYVKGMYGRLRAATQGPDGALYVTTSNRDGGGSPVSADDRVVRIAPAQP